MAAQRVSWNNRIKENRRLSKVLRVGRRHFESRSEAGNDGFGVEKIFARQNAVLFGSQKEEDSEDGRRADFRTQVLDKKIVGV